MRAIGDLMVHVGALSSAQSWLWAGAAGFGVAFAVTLVVPVFDRRRIQSESVWAKPLKFELSLAIHFLTLALVADRLSDPVRYGTLLLVTAVAAVAASAFEIVYIVFRAARQEASHFNMTTPLAGTMYVLMAVGAVILTGAAGMVALLVWLDAGYDAGPGLRWGVVLGLSLGIVLTFITAFAIGGALSHHVGTEAPGAPRMPVTGWSRTVGDRRPAHFLATHMMQVMPLVGAVCDVVVPSHALVFVAVAAVIWSGLTIAVFRHGEAGRPFWRHRSVLS